MLLSKHAFHEAPWLVGVAAGLVGLWWRGHAFVPLPFLSSYDWMEYVPSAYMVTHGVDLGGYATWRNPLYPAILGTVGEAIGYNEAAWLIASISMAMVVVAAGLGARAMANPWAGFTAAITVPLINPWAEASRWATLYPMLTASTAMTLGLGAAYMRWKTPVWGAGAAAFAGLAFGIDFRGISLLVAVAAFAVAATERRLWMLALIATIGAAGPVANQMVGISQQKETATAVGTQRALEVRLALESGDPALVQACQNEPTTEAYPSVAALMRPCAWAFVQDNLDRFKDQAPFGVAATLWALPLCVLGGRGRRRASVQSLLVFGAGFGAMFLMAVWARLNVHHFVQFAGPIAMVVPVAIARIVDSMRWSRMRAVIMAVVGLASSAWVWTFNPWAGKPVDDLATAEQHQLLGWLLDGVDLHVDEANGDQLLDCTGLGVEAALLPRLLHDGHPNFQPSATSSRCQQWISSPPQASGRVFLMTREEPDFSGPPRPPWVVVQGWQDGPRKVWLWMLVDSGAGRP